MTSEEKGKDSNENLSKTATIIETTYEKVLSIINKVKEFIKKSSSEAKNLIDDLEWVIKVITNKSLYTYDLKKTKLNRQNSEYNKFINFVTKYNEEVIEMNKRHDIVNSIFRLGKKDEILLKPSLCLKKILPKELKNMDEEIEREKSVKQKNFINVFGNQILSLYKREMERKRTNNSSDIKINRENILESKNNSMEQKEEIKNNNKSNDDNIDNDKNFNNNKKEINNNIENKNSNIQDNLNSRQKNNQKFETNNNNNKDFITFDNNNNIIKNENNLINNISNEKINKNKKDINIHRIKLLAEKEKKNNISDFSKLKLKKSKYQNINNNLSKKNYYESITKLSKQEKLPFKSFKKYLQNYYFQFTYNVPKSPDSQQLTIKNNFIINNKNSYRANYYNNKIINYNNNYNLNSNINKRKKNNNMEKSFMMYKTYRYGFFPYYNVNKNKIKNKFNKNFIQYNSMFKNKKTIKNLKNNLDLESNIDKLGIFKTESYKNLKNNKINFKKKLQINAEESQFLKEGNIYKIKSKNSLNDIQINNNNTNEENNKNKEIDNNNILEKNNKRQDSSKGYHERNEIIRTLIDKYFEDIKMITDKDFNIFDFKKKVSYKNVLPIMCKVILKTLGLIDSRIISLRKLDSFLYSVSDNYKETTLYHNSLHGSDVTQSLCIYFLNSNVEEICETSVLDLLGLMVSAMGHDLGHPALNNNFHINASTELAITYNDASCLENFHSSFLFKILRKSENNIIEKFSTQNYKTIRKRMISQILATDMANHGEVISLIRSRINIWKEEGTHNRFNLLSGNEKSKFEEQQSLLNYLIHMADLGHNCKKFEISIEWVKLLTEEFWAQGDKEKEKGLPISFLCDRNKIDVPGSQVGFLKGFIVSSFDCLVAIFPNLKYTMDNAQNNISEWHKLQQQNKKLGWTPKKEKEKDVEEKK